MHQKGFLDYFTVFIDKCDEQWRLDIVWYKQSITLIFDFQFSKRSFNIIYFIMKNWVAKAIEGVQHESRSCFPLSSYAKLNVFDGFVFLMIKL